MKSAYRSILAWGNFCPLDSPWGLPVFSMSLYSSFDCRFFGNQQDIISFGLEGISDNITGRLMRRGDSACVIGYKTTFLRTATGSPTCVCSFGSLTISSILVITTYEQRQTFVILSCPFQQVLVSIPFVDFITVKTIFTQYTQATTETNKSQATLQSERGYEQLTQIYRISSIQTLRSLT